MHNQIYLIHRSTGQRVAGRAEAKPGIQAVHAETFHNICQQHLLAPFGASDASVCSGQGCQVQENFIAKLVTKTSQKVVTKSSQKIAQNLLHLLQTAILSTQKRNSHEIKLQK